MLVKYKPTRRRNRKPKVSKAVKKYVKDATKDIGETKYNVTSNIATAYNPIRSSTTMELAFPISQGSGINQREGLKINPTSLTFNWTCYKAASADTIVRFIVIRMTDAVSAITTNTLVESINDGNVNYVNSFFANTKSVRHRFEVLHNSIYVLDDAKQNVINKSISVKVSAKPISFATSSGTGEAYGQIYFAWISDNPLLTAPSIYYSVQARYKDV